MARTPDRDRGLERGRRREPGRPSLWPLRACLLVAAFGGGAGCVPADEAIGLGSVQFTFTVSELTQEGVNGLGTSDGWSVQFDRIVLGFKTMTIGDVHVADVCSYRGRGATTDVVFDPRFGVVQTFNGLQPVECPDVGLIFGPPSNTTTLGEGATSKDLVDLAIGPPAHAIVEATAQRQSRMAFGGEDWLDYRPLRILLRFDTETTSSRFGGCRTSRQRGVRIAERERDEISVRFAAEHLFNEAIATNANMFMQPFERADEYGDGDRVVTMNELDTFPLVMIGQNGYQLPDGTTDGTLGDFVRVLFRFTITFRNDDGMCLGNEPGFGEPPGLRRQSVNL